MSSPDLSTRQLRAFLALSQQRNFTRAAALLHLSQPAFSALIRSLEQALDARLFDRNTRSVELTAEGRVFEGSAQRLLEDFGDAMGDLRAHLQLGKGRVSIAALPSLAAGWLPAIFAEYRQNWPGVDLDLHDSLSDDCIALLRTGKADFALAATGPNSMGLQTEVLCADGFHLVCRKDHPLAKRKAADLRLKDLAPYPFVHLARNSSVRQRLDAAMHPMQMNTVLEVEHLATVMGMVEAGIGISLVPALTLFHFERPTLVRLPIKAAGLTRRIYVVQREGESLSVAAQAMRKLVVQRMKAVLA
ncbi:MAG: LysR family transcriptional regulator [Gammaproteobacteria bacterium]|nr:LysR family transcriptional regulator [Gammaproteobacteria bacterium]MBU0786779.1 LysR family transcriptional regulator [Gammaproteobacteria bacterium]MBU0814015.1 LysR family transcriptional regulator [Gammaproteobacteria bacterium]MBU1788512.1 LysR family transcriptional regulator [Gammaproteobacteria bacterium]